MPAPTPPVPLKEPCSVIHDNVLYVYSADAFQSISLEEKAKWKELENGVSVTGAVCVKGGLDGDNRKSGLYVIGGSANSSNADYTGLQRFSFDSRKWETITPVAQIAKGRRRHGASYISRDNILVIYGGTTVDGYDGLSSETFTIDLKPPYVVDAFESKSAPPASKPFVLPWGEDSVLMVGGSETNRKVFTFNPGGGWVDLGMELPQSLPDASVAQAATFDMADGSKILQTFELGQTPIRVMSNVLLNPGYQLADGRLLGDSSEPPSNARLGRRQFLSAYPAYNDSSVPETTRTDFSLAQGGSGLLAFVGGDENSTVTFFNQAVNSWVPAERVLGEAPQQTLLPSSSSTSSSSTTGTSATRTASSSSTPTSSETAASGGGGGTGRNNTWAILGGVLGGLCGLVAILIIVLLCIRNKRREKRRKEASKNNPTGGKDSNEFDFDDGTHPLRENGQAMGRSPVASQVIDRSSAALFSSKPEKMIRRVSSDSRLQPDQQAASYGIFRKEKSPLGKTPFAISKPMNPNLGDYEERPSIDLGAATPAAPVNATPLATMPSRNKSQRKTDEAWAKYFTGEKVDPSAEYDRPVTTSRSTGGGGFWPGSGLSSHPSAPKFAFRDSAGNTLQTRSVGTASPVLESGPTEPRTRYMSSANPKQGRISNANSASDESSIYDDQDLDAAFSSGIPASIPNSPWPTTGNTWSGPAQRPLRSDVPPATAGTASSGDRSQSTTSSGIPNFPMPASNKAVISQVQPPGHSRDRSINTDVSWLNLGANKTAGR